MEPHLDPYNPNDPVIRANPYPAYEFMRENSPVYFSELFHNWMVSDFADCQAILKSPKASGGSLRKDMFFVRMSPEEKLETKVLNDTLSLWALFNDPPVHTRRRALINKVFTPVIVDKLKPMIQEITQELLQQAREEESPDMIARLAYPLPVLVIGAMLGLPKSDRELLKKWSDDIAVFIGTMRRSMDISREASRSMVELRQYLREQTIARRKDLGSDILSHLIRAEDEGQKLSEDEIIATAAMLLFAGHETTSNLIGNGLLSLLAFPEKLNELREHPELMPKAVDELLRYDAPVQLVGRYTLEDIEVKGIKIPKGQVVICIVGSANRDPKQFSHPDTLDFRRPENRHLSFGQGIHFCVGASLARLEGQIAFTEILKTFPTLALAPQKLEWVATHGFRGLKALRIAP